MSTKKVYFASDVHLGLRAEVHSLDRDRLFARWLSEAGKDAEAIFLVGDIFDFWYEYKKVVPKGFTRVLGKLAELADKGIPIHIFTGNHDLWMFGYFERELGAIVHRAPYEVELQGKRFVIAHGDGLGVGDKGYKLLRKAFTSRVLQFFFSMLHPRIALGLAHSWSKQSRLSKGVAIPFKGEDEPLYSYARQVLADRHVDYFVFGHRHTPLMMDMGDNAQLVILGEWIRGNEYGVLENGVLELRKFS